MGRDIEPSVITRLRAELVAQVAPPLVVSGKGHQYFFDEDSAAYSDIDVKQDEAFAVVIVQGQLPSEELIVRIWHRYSDEVWLVDRSDQMISIIPRDGLIRVFAVGETLRSERLLGVVISISTIFAIVN
jgi:hypothetical protein